MISGEYRVLCTFKYTGVSSEATEIAVFIRHSVDLNSVEKQTKETGCKVCRTNKF